MTRALCISRRSGRGEGAERVEEGEVVKSASRKAGPAAILAAMTSMRMAVLAGFALIVAGHLGIALRAQGGDSHPVSADQYERWKKELSNWGRWGKDDEIGALNLITPAKRKQAAGLVRDGLTVSLATDVNTVKA